MVRLRSLRNLIFFMAILGSCRTNNPIQTEIVWDDEQAVAITVPKSLIASYSELRGAFDVRMKGSGIRMLGNIEEDGDLLIFRPIVPLTRGVIYEIISIDKVIADVAVPTITGADPTTLLIYPTQDTVPENLLKIYLQFSRPMQQGYALKYLTLLNANGDTLEGSFLELNPELWNDVRDMLTVWLDPGRIKRGLHPNENLGQPLTVNQQYTLVVSNQWKDVNGIPLANDVVKHFAVSRRDSLSPLPSKWTIVAPRSNTTDELCVRFYEPLDYGLLNVTLHVFPASDRQSLSSGNVIKGKWRITDEERSACFTPEGTWNDGTYTLEIESRLEDLCGNNLARPFERDMTSSNGDVSPNDSSIRLSFVVK
ncbi:MAG: Ig-like domain-containing protein [Chryseolinea sp.]